MPKNTYLRQIPTILREPLRKLFEAGATSAATAAALTDSSGGTASQTLAAITGGGAGCENATKNAIASLADEVNKLITDVAALRAAVDELTA